MIFQQHFPQYLSQNRLDRYLADGWFRCQDFLYRSRLVSFTGELFSILHIRLALKHYKMSKSMRRVMRKNAHLSYEINDVSITPAKERLYEQHKERFKGRILPTLEDYLFGDSYLSIFDTKELCVYEGDKLIAVSFFDQGKESIASLLGLHDLQYKKNSLGSYTMLLEVQYAQNLGMSYYYPGYIVDESDIFDYKLNLGKMEYYDWAGQWLPLAERPNKKTMSQQLKEKTALMQRYLEHYNIPSEKKIYSYFTMGYVEEETFVKGAIFLTCMPTEETDEQIIIEYDLEEESYILSSVSPSAFDMENMTFADDEDTDDIYCSELLAYNEILFSSPYPQVITEYILTQL